MRPNHINLIGTWLIFLTVAITSILGLLDVCEKVGAWPVVVVLSGMVVMAFWKHR